MRTTWYTVHYYTKYTVTCVTASTVSWNFSINGEGRVHVVMWWVDVYTFMTVVHTLELQLPSTCTLLKPATGLDT